MTAIINIDKIKLVSCANAFPNQLITNDHLLEKLGLLCSKNSVRKARFIAKRLGIESRYLSRSLDSALSTPSPSAIELSVDAIKQAMINTTSDVGQFGYLLSHTATPHTLLPSNAAWISDSLASSSPYMELRQACTGFASALQIAVPMLCHNPNMGSICIVGSETGSVFFDINDEFIDLQQLINYVQMGDCASAVILSAMDDVNQSYISHSFSGHIGIGKPPGFQLLGAGSGQAKCEKGLPFFEHNATHVKAQGAELFLKGIEVIEGQGYKLADFKYIIPHQANGHIDSLISQHLNIEKEKVVNDAKHWGNLGSAAIWASLTGLIHSGKLSLGDKVLILGAEATKYMYGGFIYHH
ncbi:MAG: 3-oxoacyl-[acyl-carrier-protein] synthase-3 [Oceanospirillaceae bacterium]|jgi:3-oxoacyl-[acyl-carrier-protein] synthase-3